MKRTFVLIFILLNTCLVFGQKTSKEPSDSALVYVSFIVEKNGSLTNVKIKKLDCDQCSNKYKRGIKTEAIRIMKETPKWKEREERAAYILPIKFKIDN